ALHVRRGGRLLPARRGPDRARPEQRDPPRAGARLGTVALDDAAVLALAEPSAARGAAPAAGRAGAQRRGRQSDRARLAGRPPRNVGRAPGAEAPGTEGRRSTARLLPRRAARAAAPRSALAVLPLEAAPGRALERPHHARPPREPEHDVGGRDGEVEEVPHARPRAAELRPQFVMALV